MTLDTFMLVALGGVMLGTLYALIAAGLAVAWTTLGIFNFAHGAFIALGAYLAWQLGGMHGGLSLALAVPLAAGGMFLFGIGFYFVLIRPFQRKAQVVLSAVITTLAAAALIENAINLIWGARAKQIPPFAGQSFQAGSLTLSANDLVLLGLAGFTLALLGIGLRYTRFGRSLRAVAGNRVAAELFGLNVPRLYALAFGLSAAVAGLAGVMVGSLRFMNPSMGADPLLKALIVVILGGIARFSGPMYAAFLVGMAEAFAVYFAGLYWAPAILFALMIGVLVWKPEGLFGRWQQTL